MKAEQASCLPATACIWRVMGRAAALGCRSARLAPNKRRAGVRTT